MFQVKDLKFSYPKNSTLTLAGLNFSIEPGEIFGLLGPSGVGKSTTQKVLTRLLTGYEGTVLYDGKDLLSYGRDYYNQIGVGFEMPVHFSKLTAEENLYFFRRLYGSKVPIEDLLRRVGLYEDRAKRVNTLSKGMKVRLNFIRAFLNSPRFLFLDEPTNGLDPANARILKDMIKEFRDSGGTVFLTTHLMSDVDELCDRVAFMAQGKIVEMDSPKNLKMKHGQRRVTVEFESDQGVERQSFPLDNLGEHLGFLEIIKESKIITMHSEETTLEDIFIKITGVQAHG